MKARLYLVRDIYGNCLAASFHPEMLADRSIGRAVASRLVGSTKELAAAMLQSGSSKALIDAAWRMARQFDAVAPSTPFRHGDPLDVQTIEYAEQERDQLDFYIGQLVNNPNSKFYLHG